MGIAITKALVRKDLDQMKAALNEGKLPDVAAKIKNEMDLLDNTTLHIAITGASGAGKSSLVNALRGLSDSEKDSAETDEVECTKQPHPFQHPQFPKVTLWDLPGTGTPNFKADKYLKQVNFSQYDFFIIVAGNRFTEDDVKLASEIKKMKKKFYYVRTKIDNSIDSERKKGNFNETEILEKIRNYCTEHLKRIGEDSPRVFLISRWDLSKYDFPLLEKTLEEDLDDLKRHVLIMALPAFSNDIIKRKEDAMLKLIWKLSFLSCAIGAIPVPGLSLACDTAILAATMIKIYTSFGLREDSLRRLGKRVGIPVHELKSAIKNTPGAGMITTQFVIDWLQKSTVWVTVSAIELVLDFVPVVGSLVGGAGSLITTYYMLKCFLRDVVEDAQNVLAKVHERKKKPLSATEEGNGKPPLNKSSQEKNPMEP